MADYKLLNNIYVGNKIYMAMTVIWVLVTIILLAQTITNSRNIQNTDLRITNHANDTRNLIQLLKEQIQELDVAKNVSSNARDIVALHQDINSFHQTFININEQANAFKQDIDIAVMKLVTLEKLLVKNNYSVYETTIICPENTVHVWSGCYSFHVVHLDWQGAYDFCVGRGGFLPEVGNANFKFKDLLDKFPILASKIRAPTFPRIALWLNAKDHIVEGEWIWGSGGQLFLNDTRWVEGQPNNHGTGQHCLVVTFENKVVVGLEDYKCSSMLQDSYKNVNILCGYLPKINK